MREDELSRFSGVLGVIEPQVAYHDLHVLKDRSVELFGSGLVLQEKSDDPGNFA